MTPELVFFDVDGTLIPGNAWEGIFKYPRINRFKVAWIKLSILPYSLLRRLYLLGEARFYYLWMQKIASLLKNYSQADTDALFSWLVNEYLAFRPDVVNILNDHRTQQTHSVLVSTLFEEGVKKICERLGAEGAIGTRLEWKDGKVTGKIIGDACIGSRKLDFLRKYLAEKAPEVPLEDCAAYADSYSDAPMLAIVGNPVAVYPDDNLKAAALEQQWQIYPDSTK